MQSDQPISDLDTSPGPAALDAATQPSTATQADEKVCQPILRKISWRLMPFLFVLYILSYLDRINVSFAGLQMNKDLHFSDDVFGLGAGIFFLGYFLFGVPSNLMVARVGARRWISIIMVIWGGISVAMALTNNDMVFYNLRFLLGVAEAGFFPGMILYLTYWFPKKQHGTAVAKFMTAIPVAGVLGGVISSKILEMHGMLGLAGWKWLFIVTGMPSVLLGVAVWFYLCDGPEHCSWLTNIEKSQLLKLLHGDAKTDAQTTNSEEQKRNASVSGKQPRSPVMEALRSRAVWHFAILYFCLTLGMYGFQLWLPQIISGFGGLSSSQTALLTAIPAVFQAMGMIIIAGHSDRTGERPAHIAVSAGLAAIGLIGSTFATDKVVALATLSITAFGIWGTVGPFWAMPTARLSRASAAAGIALINSVGNLGGFAGPYIIGLIKTHTADFKLALDALAISLIIAAALAIFAPKPKHQEGTAGQSVH